MSRETILVALATRVGASRAPWPTLGAPFTLLADGQESVSSSAYDGDVISMNVGIHRAVSFGGDDATRSTVANATLAALISETLGSDRTLGGLCLDVRYTDGNTEYPTDGSAMVGATAMFVIDYPSTY